MTPLIEVRQLVVCFGFSEAVQAIDFHIEDGELLGLVGE